VTRLEFWPDYGAGPLWSASGDPVDLEQLRLPVALVERLRGWNGEYREDKIPVEGLGDRTWLEEGVELLRRTREALGSGYRVVATEPWWGKQPSA
jgi:hypothetical protein